MTRIATTAALMFVVWQGSAQAGIGVPPLNDVTDTIDDTIGSAITDTVEAVDEAVSDVTTVLPGAPQTGDSAKPAKGQGSSSAASGHVVAADLLDGDLLDVSSSSSETNAKGCGADATVLSIVGNKLLGSEAACKPGETVTAESGYLTELCEASGGTVCAALLFSRSSVMDSPTSMFSSADSGILSACLGGEQMHPTDGCQAPIFAAVGRTHSDAARSKDGRSASANEWSRLLELCIGGRDATSGKCSGLGINLAHSEAHSSASTTDGMSQSSGSYVLGIEAQGEDVVQVAPDALDLPPGCYADPTLCAALNQTIEATTGSGGAINQEGISAELTGVLDASVENTAAMTDITKVKGNVVSPPKAPSVNGGPKNRPPAFAGPTGPALANTGANLTAMVGVALVLIGAGLALFSGRKPGSREDKAKSF